MGSVQMNTFRFLNCIPESFFVPEWRRKLAKELEEALVPFCVAMKLSGKSVPKQLGFCNRYNIIYYIELRHGFTSLVIKPVWYFMILRRFKVTCYHRDSDIQYKLSRPNTSYAVKEVVNVFTELYEILGTNTVIP